MSCHTVQSRFYFASLLCSVACSPNLFRYEAMDIANLFRYEAMDIPSSPKGECPFQQQIYNVASGHTLPCHKALEGRHFLLEESKAVVASPVVPLPSHVRLLPQLRAELLGYPVRADSPALCLRKARQPLLWSLPSDGVRPWLVWWADGWSQAASASAAGERGCACGSRNPFPVLPQAAWAALGSIFSFPVSPFPKGEGRITKLTDLRSRI